MNKIYKRNGLKFARKGGNVAGKFEGQFQKIKKITSFGKNILCCRLHT